MVLVAELEPIREEVTAKRVVPILLAAEAEFESAAARDFPCVEPHDGDNILAGGR